MKTCRRCHETKPVSEFSPNSHNKDGLSSYCKPCRAEQQAERHRQTPAEVKAEQMKAFRAGIRRDKCAICGTPIGGEGICDACTRAVDDLGGLAGLKQAVRAVRYLEGLAD